MSLAAFAVSSIEVRPRSRGLVKQTAFRQLLLSAPLKLISVSAITGPIINNPGLCICLALCPGNLALFTSRLIDLSLEDFEPTELHVAN